MKRNAGNLTSNNYWSFAKGDEPKVAWRQNFFEGYQYENYTYMKQGVRAIREFKGVILE